MKKIFVLILITLLIFGVGCKGDKGNGDVVEATPTKVPEITEEPTPAPETTVTAEPTATAEPTGLVNVALYKPVVENAHGYESAWWHKDFITDGIKMIDDTDGSTNGWFSEGAEIDEETWVYVDLEDVYTISAVAVYPRESERYFPVAYDFQVSMDAEDWTTVKSVTGDNGQLDVDRFFRIDPVETRYVRFLVIERYDEYLTSPSYDGYIAQISELEVYYESDENGV